MEEYLYTVEFDEAPMATNMDLQTAVILAEALAEKYHEEMTYGAKIAIYRMGAKMEVEQ